MQRDKVHFVVLCGGGSNLLQITILHVSSVHSVCVLDERLPLQDLHRTDQQSENKSISRERFKGSRATFWIAGEMVHGTVCVLFFTFRSEDVTPALCGLWVLSECMTEIQCDYLLNKMKRGVGVVMRLFYKSLYSISAIIRFSLVDSVRQWVSDGATLQFNFPL